MRIKAVLLTAALALLPPPRAAADIFSMTPAGPVSGYSRNADGITLDCADGSQARIYLLAPDLARVRASFTKQLPPAGRSWALNKTDWKAPDWSVKETEKEIILATSELEVAVKRSPFLIEFRDPKSGRAICSDARPMSYGSGGRAGAIKALGYEEHFYGLGEKASRLDHRHSSFTMWNSDTYGYTEGRDPVYQSIPFYIGLEKGSAYGIFLDNTGRTGFDLGHGSSEYAAFWAETGELDYYFFYGPDMKKVLGRYTELTGRMPMPPLWALGNQQSRWGYAPDRQAEFIADKYRADDIPLDVLYLDINYMNGYRVFTWDPERFPDPARLTSGLAAKGVKVVTIVDPGVKYQPAAKEAPARARPELGPQEEHYYVYEQGVRNGYFLRKKDGSLATGRVWPGKSVFTDYTLPDASRWWGDLLRAYTDNGVAGIWNDMNEPADFDDPDGLKKGDVVYHDGGGNTGHDRNRNVYGLLMAKATYEGLQRLRPGKRPFVLTRAAYAGIQRYAAAWTGDNVSDWADMALSIPMLANMGLSGEVFVGSDLGGFTMGRPTPELMTRWYQVNFLTPFFRNHKDMGGYDSEPWRLPDYYRDIVRGYVKLRYRLLPFLYTAFAQAHETGLPVMRPLVLNYQEDRNTLNMNDQFMAGSDILVAPVLAEGRTQRKVYLPAGEWYDFWTGKRFKGGTTIDAQAPLETVPLYVRAGAVVPFWPEMKHTGEIPVPPVTFKIYPDENGAASGVLYEDDGETTGYASGVYRRTRVKVTGGAGAIRIETACEGSYAPAGALWSFEIEARKASAAELDGRPLPAGAFKREGGRAAVTIAADGRPHVLVIR